jgi:hypothetical protein
VVDTLYEVLGEPEKISWCSGRGTAYGDLDNAGNQESIMGFCISTASCPGRYCSARVGQYILLKETQV